MSNCPHAWCPFCCRCERCMSDYRAWMDKSAPECIDPSKSVPHNCNDHPAFRAVSELAEKVWDALEGEES